MADTIQDSIENIEDLVAEGEYDKAQAAVAAAYETFGKDPELVITHAELLLEIEDFEGVVAAVSHAESVEDMEQRAQFLAARGYALFYTDQFDAARHAFNDGVKADPELFSAVVGRAMVHEHLGFYNAAMLDLERAIAMDSTEGQPFAIRGAIHLRFGRVDQAQKDLQFAIDSNPHDEESRLNLARIYALGNNRPAAMELLEVLLEDGEDADYVAPGALLRSQLSLALGSYDAGLEDAKLAIELIPELPWGYLQAAACVLGKGAEPGVAIDLLKQAEETVESIYDIPDIFLLRATAYDQLGKPDKAQEWTEKAEGVARLPGFVYGSLNPAGNIPINPGKPIDIRALLDDLFGEAKNAPKGYEDVLRQIVARIPEIVKEHPNVGQLQIELPEAPGMVGGKRQLVVQVNQQAQQAQARG
ncbi:MAG: tetratricopeptide repeat protein [bacterium]